MKFPLLTRFGMKRRVELELARRSFFDYCCVIMPKFYKRDREYLKQLCDELQDFYESADEVAIVNLPPRHGKSLTAMKLAEWIFGKNREAKIMTGSYNETLSTNFSKGVRNSIMEQKADKEKVVYRDVFPDTQIKRGDGAMKLWALEGGYNNYLATSPTGTATGFGASILLIDDLIKNSMEAYNADVLDKHWDWFTNTMLSRLEEGGKIIIIMTRWANADLAGRAIKHFTVDDPKRIRHINMKAMQEDGSMLCEEVLSRKSFESKKKAMGEDIAMANYQQEPLDQKGKLYTRFSTYKKLPEEKDWELISAYTDTADEGTDYLVSIVGIKVRNKLYIIDILCTQEPMEVTEELTAKQFVRTKTEHADIESNNGGKGFARNVGRFMKENLKSTYTVVDWFHQSENKRARILSNATNVMNYIVYPEDWETRWSEYAEMMKAYQKEGKNKFDDCPDATTGLYEKTFPELNSDIRDPYGDYVEDDYDEDFDDY